MGNRRRPRRSSANARLVAAADALDGSRIPGGCDDCGGYQTVESDPAHPGTTYLATHHDDGCPFLSRYGRSAT